MNEISDMQKLERIQKLNQSLLDILTSTSINIINYAREHNIELPYEIKPLLEEAQKYIQELKHPISINKHCFVWVN